MSIGHPIPELWLIQNLTLKIKGQSHGWGHSSKSQCGSNILSTHIPFIPCQSALPIPEIQHFQNLTLEIKGQGQMTLVLHNYKSRQFHRTSNSRNPSSDFKDMGSAKSGPSAAWFDKFSAHGQTHIGQITMTVHNYRSRQVHETLNGVHPSSGFRDMRSAKSGPNLLQIWQVFGPWASPYRANGQVTMAVHN